MQVNPVSPQVAAHPVAESAPKAAPIVVEQKPTATESASKAASTKKDSAYLSQRARDLAAQLSGKTMQEEAKESPVVEMNEEQGKGKK